MLPVVVTAWLTSPLIGEPVHLDGLLGLAWARRHPRQSTSPTRLDRASSVSDVHLPLARLAVAGADCWIASAAIDVGPVQPAATWQTRRRDAEDWDYLDKPVLVSAGPAKDCLVRRESRSLAAVRWLCIGKRAEIRKSLKLLWGPEDDAHGSLGSVRRAGAGELVRWSIGVGEHSPSDCLVHDGAAVRHLPEPWVESAGRWRIGATRPPYWLPDHQHRTPVIGTPVVLRPPVLDSLPCSSTLSA